MIEIFPLHKEHVLLTVEVEEGISPGGVYLRQSEDFPRTQGTVLELPRDRSYLDKEYPEGLDLGDRVIFARYAHVEGHVVDSWDWEEVPVGADLTTATVHPVMTRRPVYAVHIADIQAVIGHFV
jgi:co-chaperonin GroES (HSP10)